MAHCLTLCHGWAQYDAMHLKGSSLIGHRMMPPLNNTGITSNVI